ncbi:MAG: TonB-dependent receptor, partial [Deltaproteobacteria bacterium]|nr:TonB-dependent receptor [Deltaproteobacteria bacterium]
DLYGVEIEARKSLEFVAPELRSFTAIANLTVAQSSVQLDGAARDFLTSAERPMMNQAPYVLNLALDWEHTTGTTARVLYNVQGARIEQVGAQGLPDAYLQPRHVIDLYAGQDLGEHFQVRFVATDLLNAPFVTTQGERRTDDNVMFRYTNGSRYTLTATYTH